MADSQQSKTATAFLKISSVAGDSQRSGYTDQIEVHGHQFSISQPQGGTASQAGSFSGSRAQVSTLKVGTNAGVHSPLVMGYAFNGKSIGDTELTTTSVINGETTPLVTYTLSDPYIAYSHVVDNMESDGENWTLGSESDTSGSSRPKHIFGIAFSKMEVKAAKLDNTGASQGNVTSSFSPQDGSSS
ncbi:hypothetical protein Pan216_32920 [Planctomycetes bacterium Pan216]|uniref:Uncharacterized protein n=1 Tax=Kolteria novifilia TaxID=2527975 RepID=A0A518B628_9BACT|nr:hypothetical protein Pan216_32920 [Planctomycetes bacterium Pan216]